MKECVCAHTFFLVEHISLMLNPVVCHQLTVLSLARHCTQLFLWAQLTNNDLETYY